MIKQIFFRFLLVTIFMLMLTGCDEVTEPEETIDPTEFTEYELVWSDEFNQSDSTLDESNWGYDLGYGSDGWGNDEWQEYTNDAENVRVENGNLVISVNYDSTTYNQPGKRDGSVTSARINTRNKWSFKYGKVQARIKPPVSMGMWPAFWMLGTSFEGAGWPYCGEIDIMEMSPLYHGEDTSMFTLHWWDDDSESHASDGGTRSFNYSLGDDYHIFEVEWDEQRIVGKIDDITYYVRLIDPDTMNEFLREFFIIMNVAVGGNLGGIPDAATVWGESMYVDWVRVYQGESNEEEISSFGIFTDNTAVDDGITVGLNAEIYVWENTLESGNISPYEGDNVIAWTTTGIGWFGGGIASNSPEDLSGFSEGYLKFMIKIPGDVTFKIGINDVSGNENYVTFPANQTVYGLSRNGDWGQAVIPIADIKGNVDLSLLSYEFMILEENGTQCSFAIDDIYWDGGGVLPSSIAFNAASYSVDASSAEIMITDQEAANTDVSVEIGNGTETIDITVSLDEDGSGNGTVNFGVTNDDTDTIEITAGGSITANYTDSSGAQLSATAMIEGGGTDNYTGIYSESHTEQMLNYEGIINSADWSGNSVVPDEENTEVTPVDGTFVLSADFEAGSATYGGITFNFGSAGQDVSAYSTLIFSLDKSAMTALVHLGIKFEDASGGNTEVDITGYTPEITANWAKYEIPLSDYPGVDFTQMMYLGIWNPKDAGDTMLFGKLYFDDIYLTN